jgi:hypothetical protein
MSVSSSVSFLPSQMDGGEDAIFEKAFTLSAGCWGLEKIELSDYREEDW